MRLPAASAICNRQVLARADVPIVALERRDLGRELPILIASFDGYFPDCGALKAAVQSADRKRPCSQFYSKTISKKAGKSGISAVWRARQNEDENWVIAICPLIL
jgi:hypothetical protein